MNAVEHNSIGTPGGGGVSVRFGGKFTQIVVAASCIVTVTRPRTEV